jgi:hypothetical protein
MDYTYTIRKVSPENNLVGIIYHADGMPDYFHNITTQDFSAANISYLVDNFAPAVRLTWEKVANPPASEVTEGDSGAGVAIKYIRDPLPEYDPTLERVETTETYDAPTATYTYTHTVVAMTAEEIVEAQRGLDEENKQNSVASQNSLLIQKLIDPSTLSDEEMWQYSSAYPLFEINWPYVVDELVYYKGTLYKCLQAHTSQADWRPDVAVSLWTTYRDPEVISAWVQPTGAHDAYDLGAQVTHNGKTWSSDVAANVWEPGVSQWTEVV